MENKKPTLENLPGLLNLPDLENLPLEPVTIYVKDENGKLVEKQVMGRTIQIKPNQT